MTQLLGLGGNQVSTNSELGGMAQQNPDNVNISGGIIEATLIQDENNSDSMPLIYLDYTAGRLDLRQNFRRWSRGTYYDGKTIALAECNLAGFSQNIVSGTSESGINTYVNTNDGPGGGVYPWYFYRLTGSGNNNGTTAPDGYYTASLLLETSETNTHFLRHSTRGDGGIDNLSGYWTISLFIKNYSGGRHVRISCGHDGDNYACLTVRSSDGAITGTARTSTHNGASGATQLVGSPGSINVSVVNSGVIGVGNGWYRMWMTMYGSFNDGIYISLNATADPPLATSYGIESYAGNTGYGVYFWGLQVEPRAYLTDYIRTSHGVVCNSFYQLCIADMHQPRIDHDPTNGSVLGLRMEEGHTNYCTYSEDPSQAVWSKVNVNITTNAMMAPIGTWTAPLIYDTGGSATRYLVPENYGSRSDDIERIMSVFVKERTISGYDNAPTKKRYLWLGVVSSSGNYWGFYIFDIANKTLTCARSKFDTSDDNPKFYTFDLGVDTYGIQNPLTTSELNIRYGMEELGAGWVRVHIYVYTRISGSGETVSWRYGMTDKAVAEDLADLAYTGDSVSGLYMWGFEIQNVKGNVKPGSYIRTLAYASSISRDYMVINPAKQQWHAGDFRDYIAGAYTVYAEMSQTPDDNSMLLSWYSMNGGAYLYLTGSGVRLYMNRTINLYASNMNANFTHNQQSIDKPTQRMTYKFAAAFKSGDIAVVTDSGEEAPVVRVSNAMVPTGFTGITIGAWDWDAYTQPEGCLRKIIVYKGRVPNSELIGMVN